MSIAPYLRVSPVGALLQPSRIPSYVRELVRAGLMASALASPGCSEAPAPPPSPPVSEPRAAEPSSRLLSLPGFAPVSCESIADAELVRDGSAGELTLWRGSEVYLTRGIPCATAADRAACELAIEQPFTHGPEGDRSPSLRITGASGAILLESDATSRERLRTLLGPIDSIPRAFVWAFMNEKGVTCGPDSRFRVDGERVQMVATPLYSIGESAERTLLEVSESGVFVVRDREPLAADPDGVADGRRPDGLRGAPAAADLGSYLARMAYHEAASILAFEELGGALGSWGAPRALVDACFAAARDEARHATHVAACAAAHGARLHSVEHAPRRARSLASLALENAREGCVRETYGAVAAAYQAEAALDPSVRALMSGIAEDEAEHAALSFRIARWMDARLSPDERARIRGEHARAGGALARRLETSAEPPYARQLGLPPPPVAAALAARLRADLWA